MAERLVPISRKQHDSVNNLIASIRHAQEQLQTMANTLLMAVDEDLGQVGVTGAVCRDGVYSLAVEVPDIAPKTEEPTAQANAG
jgi:hypothetical protein